MKADGNIEIKGNDVTVQGSGRVNVKQPEIYRSRIAGN
jgi:hypothetical protein